MRLPTPCRGGCWRALAPVLKDWAHTQAGFHLYVPTREQTPPKVRALLDFLVEKRDATRLD